ncbi:MAG TPA: hypothetical protein VH817_20430 [Thermoleophilaceae bacterium]|jgi:hypothetical protein
MQRLLVRGAALAIIALLAFLTLGVALEHGVDVLVVVSFIVLAIVGIGVFGALGSDE